MSKSSRLTYNQFERRLLVAAYWTSNRLQSDDVSLEEISREFDIRLYNDWISKALSNFDDGGLVHLIPAAEPVYATRISLTPAGLLRATQLMDEGVRSQDARVAEHRQEEPTLKTASVETGLVPASDRVVTLGDNSRVRNAQSSTELALKAISDSNTLDPESKALFTSNIKVGLQLLKNPKTYMVAISGLLLKPLYDAYTSVIEEASKPVIQSAIDAVLALLG